MMTTKPRNIMSLCSSWAFESRVERMQYREKAAMMRSMATLALPVQMRVFDSLSYLRMTASRSACMDAASSSTPSLSMTEAPS